MKVVLVRLVTGALVSAMLLSCAPKESADGEDTIFFAVDEALLGEKYVDSVDGFSVGIPEGLHASDMATLLGDKQLTDSVLAFFMDSAKTATYAVRVLPFDSLEVARILEKPDSTLNPQKIWASVAANTFVWNKLLIHQVMSQNSDVVNFRLLLKPAERYIEINFTIQRSVYPQYLKKIESSFGSLHKI